MDNESKEIYNIINSCKELLNSDIYKEIEGLTLHKLLADLHEALIYDKGYYKNNDNEFIYVKGIEVTNDIANISRMGFNGEDKGVWIHYAVLNKKEIYYYDKPVSSFSSFFSACMNSPEKKFYTCTKEEFEEQLKTVISNILSDYEGKRPIKEYFDFVKNLNESYEKFENSIISPMKNLRIQ